MITSLKRVIQSNREGMTVALPSICSAHRDVLRAAMLMPEGRGRPLLVEATSNQVNQDGGYTGMTPSDFAAYVFGIAQETGFDAGNIILGGDHLGPQAWKNQAAEAAMAKARALAGAYVEAGFSKIHLDCSEGCKGEPSHLDDQTVAVRSADLAAVCEATAPDPSTLCYIVGTEVPVPGGGRANHAGVAPTDPAAAKATLDAHLAVFPNAAAERIAGLVVQPGVEFSATEIDHLPDDGDTGLREVLNAYPGIACEAHSTDYQKPDAYRRLAEMGFAFHKVGPALTFAYRQAIYALDHLRAQLLRKPLYVQETMEAEMVADARHWKGHYAGNAETLRVLRHFAYSDRIRYYWPRPAAEAAVSALLSDLEEIAQPARPLLLQYFACFVLERAEVLPSHLSWPDRHVLAIIQEALAPCILEDAT